MRTHPGERFGRRVTLTPEVIADFARAAGDMNPLHHDADHARRSCFGAVIASGPQTSALLMALTATHFSERGAMVGLEFSFRFRAPVRAETVTLEWLVVRVRASRALRGEVVELRGRLVTSAGRTAVGAKGKVLVTS